MMTAFDRLASGYDLGMWPLEWLFLRRLRRIFSRAHGRVLEIGVGTGVNLPHYGREVNLVALDHSLEMLGRAFRRPHPVRMQMLQADVQALPLRDNSFDMVVGSLVFCSIDDPPRALAEIRRVLRSGGRLLLLEHVRGERGLMRRLTDGLNPVWHRLSKSCRLNRDTAQAVADAGMHLVRASRHASGIVQIIEALNP
ncbi:MAG TPA: methyltransferase domain-containing protein [Chloroflexi bacterium]|jgi:ubiquinone/menaquinone biosynthesis C-methylase UbiE|nr:methyltransferase domain-containing protein [Chloroflexota bacterium]